MTSVTVCPRCHGARVLASGSPWCQSCGEFAVEPYEERVAPAGVSCPHEPFRSAPVTGHVVIRADPSCESCSGVELEGSPEEFAGALAAARTLLPTHSEEQLARMREFGCSSLLSSDQPCGCCVDCTPEEDLIPPRFAVADLPGFDEAAARRLAELEIKLDEGTRSPAPVSPPKPWLLPVMVVLYPIALLVALGSVVSPFVCRVTRCGCRGLRGASGVLARVSWARVFRFVVVLLAILAALGVGWAVLLVVSWLWSVAGWVLLAVPVGVVVGAVISGVDQGI